jgi:tripartite-type tricarboxylate transporter receptor subunit TctC
MRVTIATCSAVVSLALAGEAVLAASEYPNRTVKIIVPTSPGAVTDVQRALAQALSRT